MFFWIVPVPAIVPCPQHRRRRRRSDRSSSSTEGHLRSRRPRSRVRPCPPAQVVVQQPPQVQVVDQQPPQMPLQVAPIPVKFAGGLPADLATVQVPQMRSTVPEPQEQVDPAVSVVDTTHEASHLPQHSPESVADPAPREHRRLTGKQFVPIGGGVAAFESSKVCGESIRSLSILLGTL